MGTRPPTRFCGPRSRRADPAQLVLEVPAYGPRAPDLPTALVLQEHSGMRTLKRTLVVFGSVGLFGCGFAHVNVDTADKPDRAMGTGATIMMPGDSPPPLTAYDPFGGGAAPSGSAPSQSTGSSSSSSQNPGTGSGSGTTSSRGTPAGRAEPQLTMIGGATQDRDSEERLRDSPLGPLAILFGYPYWIFGKTLGERADDAAKERKLPPPEPELVERPSHPVDSRQHQRLRRENEELARQLAQSPHVQPAQPLATPRGALSIQDELAALERSMGRGGAVRATAERRGAVDRNADGRPDLWSRTDATGAQREALDENHDGRVDRVLHYDAERRLVRSEHDADGDGGLETLSYYENGELSRRTVDSNGDDVPDRWMFYRAGELTRHEIDRNNDGSRDVALFYTGGELVREEEDRDGDGRADLTIHYRNGEIVERSEDTDFDGTPDIRSFYEHGRLVRRELG